MKIVAMYNGVYPGGMAMSQRLHLYALSLLKQGIDIHIAVARRPPGSVCKRQRRYVEDNVIYEYILDMPAPSNPLRKLVQDFIDTFFWVRWLCRNRKRFDILFLVQYDLVSTIFITVAVRLFRKKIVFEMNENPYSYGGSRLAELKWLNNLNRHIFLNFICPFVNGFIVISEPLKDLVQRKARTALILKVPILIDCDSAGDKVQNTDRESSYIIHAGSLSEKKDGIIAVFQAYAQVKRASVLPVKFILTNKVAMPSLIARLEKIIEENHLQDFVVFKNFLSRIELQALVTNASLAILNKPSNNQNDYNFPSKLGEYLAAGVPVLASKGGEMSRFLEHRRNALLFEPNDVEGMRDCILDVLDDDNLAKALSINGRLLAHSAFDYKIHAERIANFFLALMR